MAKAATITREAGLSGIEFGLAIPGTVGGAVWANAGAHEPDVARVLVEAVVVVRRRQRGVARRRTTWRWPTATAASSTRAPGAPGGRDWRRRSS